MYLTSHCYYHTATITLLLLFLTIPCDTTKETTNAFTNPSYCGSEPTDDIALAKLANSVSHP
jgi:hypothetical protein